MDVSGHLADPTLRQRFVTRLFDIIAPRYDRFTRVFSFGMDESWKRELLAFLPTLPAGSTALDLACGTGDLALAVAARAPDANTIGLDASPRMIDAARRRAGASSVRFEIGDMAALPFADSSVRSITCGYGFRNVPDFRSAIAEVARVLEPGGTLVVLDFYQPRSAVWRTLFLAYLRAAGNLIGWLWHGEAVVYGYIAPSIAMYVDAHQFALELERAGFQAVVIREKLLGGVAIHVAHRSTDV